MRHKHLRFGYGFRVVLGDGRSQAAQMTLGTGETEGGPDTRHRGADQWLFVVSGAVVAVVNGERVELQEGTLLLIQRGDRHEIRNTGTGTLKTPNVHVPPAYTEEGEELPAGKGQPSGRLRHGWRADRTAADPSPETDAWQWAPWVVLPRSP
jgi:mannose-6-phosphate isomerase-like protein (cupin superfamily)